MNEPVARPFEEGFDAAWQKITRETDEILLPPECRSCKKRPFCMICGALAIAEGHGCSYKKPEYLCRQTEVFLEEMEKEYRRLRCWKDTTSSKVFLRDNTQRKALLFLYWCFLYYAPTIELNVCCFCCKYMLQFRYIKIADKFQFLNINGPYSCHDRQHISFFTAVSARDTIFWWIK